MSLFLQGKEPTDPTEKQYGWTPEPVWTIWRTEKPPVTWIEPLSLGCAPRILVSLLTELLNLMWTNTWTHEHAGGENFSGRTHYKDARRCRGWYGMKHGAPGLTCFALHGCICDDILITELRHLSSTANYILCPLTSVRLVLTVPIEQRSSGSLTTPTPRPPAPSGAAQLVHKTQLTGSVKVVAPIVFT